MVDEVASKSRVIGISVGYYFLVAFGGVFTGIALLIAADNDWFYYGINFNMAIFSIFIIFGLSLIGSPSYLKFTGESFIVVKRKAFFFNSFAFYALKNFRVIAVVKKSYFEPTKILYEKNMHKGFAVYLLTNASLPPLEISQFRFFFGDERELEKYLGFAKEVSLLTGLPIEMEKNVVESK